jgi:uncharacterized protein with PQ loop repeat
MGINVEHFCGILAPIASIFLCLSPIPTIQHILHDEKVGNYPLLPYTMMLINTLLWLAYGLLKQDSSLWITNGFAVLLGLYYWFSYIKFANTATSVATLPGSVQMHAKAITATTIAIFLWTFVPYISNPSGLLGFAAMLSGILLYASPFASLQCVVATKCAKSIPLPFTIASFISCSLWAIYGLFQTHDLYIYTPGIIGCALSLSQLCLKIYYGDSFLSEIQEDIHVLIEEKQQLLTKAHGGLDGLLEFDMGLPTTYDSLT